MIRKSRTDLWYWAFVQIDQCGIHLQLAVQQSNVLCSSAQQIYRNMGNLCTDQCRWTPIYATVTVN